MTEPGKESKKGRVGKTSGLETRLAKTKEKPQFKNDVDEGAKGQETVILEGLKKVSTARGRKKIKPLEVTGLSLKIKFALFISLVSALLCFSAGLAVYSQVQKTMLLELDRKGASLVRAVAGLAQEYHERCNKTPDQEIPAELTAEKNALDEKLKNTQPGPARDRLSEQWDEVQGKINHIKNARRDLIKQFGIYLEKIIALESGKEKLLSEDVLSAAFVRSASDAIIISAKGDRELAGLTGTPRSFIENMDNELYETNITIVEGSMATKKGRRFRVRAYRMPVVAGEIDAMITLSQEDMERTSHKIWSNILLTTGIAMLLGIFISLILAVQVTTPLERLVQDIEIVANGDLGHTTRVQSKDEIGILAHTFNIMTQNLKTAHDAEIEQQARAHEMEVAVEIQANLLPAGVPRLERYDIASYYKPAKEVSGDYFDFIDIDSNHIGFIIADVSGKSIPGSMVMAMTRALIRMEALRNLSPAKTFVEVNKILAQDIRKGMFVTAMYAVLDVAKGELCVSSAGHNPMIVWRNGLKQHQLINPKGMALGLNKGSIFDKTIHEETCQVQPGDRVVLYTDGVSEAMSPKNEEFGDERLCQLIAKYQQENAQSFINFLVRSLDDWRKDCPQSDDITIVTMKKS